MSIGTIVVDLLARTGSFETDTKRAAKIAQQRAKEIDEAFTKAGKAIGVALAAGATAAAYAFKTTVDRMDELSKAAQRASMPTEDFSRLAYAADLADVSMQDLQGSMGKLAKAQGDAARGVAEQARAFDALGISYRNADGSLRDTSAVFLDFADRFEEFQGSPEIVTLGMQLFGRSFQTLIPLLKDGADGLRDAGAEADALGVTLSTKAGQQAEAFNDNITRLTKAVEGLKIELFSGLIPQLDAVIERFLAATREGLGFVDAIDIALNVSGFQKLDEKIAITRDKITDMQRMIDTGVGPGGGFVNVEALQKEIDKYQALLDRLIRTERRIMGRDPATGSLGPLVSEPPTEKPRTLRLLGGSTGKGQSADPLASVLDAAIQRDFDRMQTAREQAAEFEDFIAQLLADDEAKLRGQADAWRDLIDPTRAYTRQLEEIRRLVDAGALSATEGAAAEFEVESRRNDDLLRGLGEQTDKASDAARELGLTFQSAFEDAIIEGKKLSDVLGGIGQDLLRLTIRKAITEPAANWLASGIGSIFGGARADGGPVSAGSTYLVGERGPELFTPKTSGGITPNHALGPNVSVVNHYKFESGVNVAQLTHYAERIKQDTVATVFDRMRRANHAGDYALTGG